MRLVLLGPPGAGKGSLATLLKDNLGLLHISTGDMLREEMKNGTSLGQEVKRYVEKGELVPDQVVIKLIENRISDDKLMDKGYMLDGFPRNKQQAESLDLILGNINKSLDYVVYLEANLEVILSRLTGRRVCKSCGALYHMKNKPPKQEGVCDSCGGEVYQRADDNEETIKNRMEVYLESTIPMVDYYQAQGKLKKIDGNLETHELQEILIKKLNEDQEIHQH